MKKIKYILCSMLLLFFAFPSIVKADGALIPPPDYFIAESSQEAVIIHNNGVEELILSIAFEGDAKDFAWVVPTPAKPEIGRSSNELFTALDDYTGYSGFDYGYGAGSEPLASTAEKDTVTVVESKRVDIYDTIVLEAKDAKDLAKWLNDNGYVYPEKEAYIFDYYIQKGWYFTAAKINAEYVETNSAQNINTGHSTPLKLTFNSEKAVYPLKISSVQYKPKRESIDVRGTGEAAVENNEGVAIYEEYDNYYDYGYGSLDYVPISLYVFANNKKSLPGFSTQYANYVEPDVIKDFAFVDGEPWFEPTDKMYLTKLYRNMDVSEMTDDLYLRDAKEKEPIGGATRGELFLSISFVVLITILGAAFSPCGLLYIIGSLLHIGKKRSTHVAGWIMQWIGFAAIAVGEIILVGYLLVQDDELSQEAFYNLTAAAITLGLLILVMVIVMIWQKVRISKRAIKE